MTKAVVAGTEPIVIEIQAGEEVYWCRCGRSKDQPFCDGSHEGSGFEPLMFKPATTMKVRFCACKQTKRPPFCDGSHLEIS